MNIERTTTEMGIRDTLNDLARIMETGQKYADARRDVAAQHHLGLREAVQEAEDRKAEAARAYEQACRHFISVLLHH